MTWGLICKPTASSYSIAKEIYPLLDDVIMDEKVAVRFGTSGWSLKEIGKRADQLIVIGGDGTILMAMHYTERPMFTINTGSVGFMTEVDAENAVAGIKKVMKGEYYIEERMRIKTVLNDKRLADATNEVTVHTAAVGKILSLQLAVNDVVTEKIDGDGMIVATPTGSTSYALSVGGPIVDPLLHIFVVAPMAPFRHIASPLVIPADNELEIAVIGKKKAKLVIDGTHKATMTRNDDLRLSCSDKTAAFIRLENNFYSKVFEKLSFAGKRTNYGQDSSD